MSKAHIVIVEDEAKIAQILVDYLKNDDFETTPLLQKMESKFSGTISSSTFSSK